MHTEERWIKVREFFRITLIPAQGHRPLEPIPAAQSARQAPTLESSLFPLRVTHIHTHTQSDWESVDMPAHLTCMYLWWEGTKGPRENLHRRGENMQTPHKQWPQPENYSFSHQCIMEWCWMKPRYSRTCCTSFPISSQTDI